MFKIDSISRGSKSVNPIKCAILGMIITAFVSWVIWLLYPINYIDYFSKENVLEILFVPISVVLSLIIHELIHVFFFKILVKDKKAIIKVKYDNKYRAIIMHQTNEDVYYTAPQMVIILTSPFFILTFLLFAMLSFMTVPLLLYVTLVLNVLGSSIDLYLSFILLSRYKRPIVVNFDSDEVVMNIYSKG